MDEDRLTPRLGRLIDAAKAAARAGLVRATLGDDGTGGGAPPRGEGWAVLGEDGEVFVGLWLAATLDAAVHSGTSPQAAAFALAGESDDTQLPAGGWRTALAGADPHLPVVVKHLGRWVVVTLEEIPGG